MKQNQAQQNEEKQLPPRHLPPQAGQRTTLPGDPHRVHDKGNRTAATMALKRWGRGDTLQATTFPPVNSILKNWMEAFIWASKEGRSQSRWYEKLQWRETHSVEQQKLPLIWILGRFPLLRVSTTPLFSFLTPSPPPRPVFSSKVKESKNQIDNSKTGQNSRKWQLWRPRAFFKINQKDFFPSAADLTTSKVHHPGTCNSSENYKGIESRKSTGKIFT